MRPRESVDTRRAVVVAAISVAMFTGAVTCGGGSTGGRHLGFDASAPTSPATTAAEPTTGTSRRTPQTVPSTALRPTPPTTALPTTVLPATVPPPPTSARPPAAVAGAGVAVGDSVLEDVKLYAPGTLASHNIAINAAVSRQWPVGIGIINSLRAAGKLPPVVIVALGSNGRITDALFDQMMQACAGAQRVVFMTVTGPLIANNPIITAGVARHPTAVLADWNTLANAHPEWFAPDHVHIGPAGATALGNLLASMG